MDPMTQVYLWGALGATIGAAAGPQICYLRGEWKASTMAKHSVPGAILGGAFVGGLVYGDLVYRPSQSEAFLHQQTQAGHIEDCQAKVLEDGSTVMEFDGQYYVCP